MAVEQPPSRNDGFDSFAAIYCLRNAGLDGARLQQRWSDMGLRRPVESVPVISTREDPRIGTLATHRRLVAAASESGLETILVFDEQALWHEHSAALLKDATAELGRFDWELCILGGQARLPLTALPGCRALSRAAHVQLVHAVAYHRRGFARLLAEWPAQIGALADEVRAKGGLDASIARQGRVFAVLPTVACLPGMLPFQPPRLQHVYVA